MSKIFFYIQMIYIVFTFVIGISTFFNNTPISTSLSGILAPLIAWFGGSGLRGSFNLGDLSQKITGTILGVIALIVSYLWINYTGYWIRIYDFEFTGVQWAVIGFTIGLLFSTKEHSKGNI